MRQDKYDYNEAARRYAEKLDRIDRAIEEELRKEFLTKAGKILLIASIILFMLPLILIKESVMVELRFQLVSCFGMIAAIAMIKAGRDQRIQKE